MKNICVINGHPDPSAERFAAAIADAYAKGAESAGHTVSRIAIGEMELGFLTNSHAFAAPATGEVLEAQTLVDAADHVVLVYPLWLGTVPGKLKVFLEQLGRGDFFLATQKDGVGWPAQNMVGKSARVIVTMGMPKLVFRLLYRSHSLRALEGMILKMSGFKPVRDTVFGQVDKGQERRERFLAEVEALGERGG
ncbi:MAG: NAD(P)H-dependent oxidoreductase [Devosia sp.]